MARASFMGSLAQYYDVTRSAGMQQATGRLAPREQSKGTWLELPLGFWVPRTHLNYDPWRVEKFSALWCEAALLLSDIGPV
jgi:hypothetical protein